MEQWDNNWRDSSFRENWLTPAPDVVELATTLRQRRVKTVLDLGCGIGRHAHLLAVEGFSVTGTDASPAGIDFCRRWFEEEGLVGEFFVRDMGSITEPPGSFDAVLAYNSIYHCRRSQLETILDLIADVLSANGVFYGTFIDKKNRKYGVGREIEPHTFVMDDGFEAGVPHVYVDEADLRAMLSRFEIRSLTQIEQKTNIHIDYPSSSKLAVLAVKR